MLERNISRSANSKWCKSHTFCERKLLALFERNKHKNVNNIGTAILNNRHLSFSMTHMHESSLNELELSQRSLHNAPIFRLLLKVAVNGTHQCDFQNFCEVQTSTLMARDETMESTAALHSDQITSRPSVQPLHLHASCRVNLMHSDQLGSSANHQNELKFGRWRNACFGRNNWPWLSKQHLLYEQILMTVLAQDHCYSVSLANVWTMKAHMSTVVMLFNAIVRTMALCVWWIYNGMQLSSQQ